MTGSVGAGPKRDALPEGANYPDDSAGCKINKTCLDCPLEVCIDEGPWLKDTALQTRNKEIFAYWHSLPAGTSKAQVVTERFGLSKRHVARVMALASEPDILPPTPQIREPREYFKLAQPAALLPGRMP